MTIDPRAACSASSRRPTQRSSAPGVPVTSGRARADGRATATGRRCPVAGGAARWSLRPGHHVPSRMAHQTRRPTPGAPARWDPFGEPGELGELAGELASMVLVGTNVTLGSVAKSTLRPAAIQSRRGRGRARWLSRDWARRRSANRSWAGSPKSSAPLGARRRRSADGAHRARYLGRPSSTSMSEPASQWLSRAQQPVFDSGDLGCATGWASHSAVAMTGPELAHPAAWSPPLTGGLAVTSLGTASRGTRASDAWIGAVHSRMGAGG